MVPTNNYVSVDHDHDLGFEIQIRYASKSEDYSHKPTRIIPTCFVVTKYKIAQSKARLILEFE